LSDFSPAANPKISGKAKIEADPYGMTTKKQRQQESKWRNGDGKKPPALRAV
jgi:hypothetical protein